MDFIHGLLAQLGLIELIALGYGTLTWVFLIVALLPLLTWGIWRLIEAGRATGAVVVGDTALPGPGGKPPPGDSPR